MTPAIEGRDRATPESSKLMDTPSAGDETLAPSHTEDAPEPIAAQRPICEPASPLDAVATTWRLVLEPQRLLLAAGVGMTCAVGVLLLSSLFGDIIPTARGSVSDTAGKCVTALWVAACLGLLSGAVAWMVKVEEEEARRPGCLEGLAFIGSRWLGLASVLPRLALLTFVPFAAVGHGLRGLAGLSSVGSFAVGLMSIPVFIGLCGALLGAFLSLMVPCVMGSENVHAFEAVRRVVALLRGQWRAVVSDDLTALLGALPLLAVMWGIGWLSWRLTVKLCLPPGGEAELAELSMWLLGALCCAFWAVYAAVIHTMAYRCHHDDQNGAPE